jgi:uncharacterized membrane protein
VKRIWWPVFIFFAIFVGIYPLAYVFFDMQYGFLATKSAELLRNKVWQWAFYQHIFFGGVALLLGWSQFSKRLRNKYLQLHRNLGRIYVATVLLSGFSGLFIAFYATGGIIASAGFIGLALSWITTTAMAFLAVRKRRIDDHQHWMIRSYALCFAAVTLRIWLPLFQFGFAMDFILAYRIIAWLCWVPNLAVAEIIIQNLKTRIALNVSDQKF